MNYLKSISSEPAQNQTRGPSRSEGPQLDIRASNLGKKFEIYFNDRDRVFELFSKKRYHEDFWALKGVSFEVPRGSAFGVIGSNGAGKSTLLRLLAGVSKPTEGEIAVYASISSLLDLGLGFHESFSGRDNIYLNCTVLGLNRPEINEIISDVVAFAELESFIDYPVKTYSAGMCLRLGFAIASHLNHQIFLIDEVLTVGDQYFQRKCVKKIEEFIEQGRTIVLVSHDLHSVRSLCDRVLWLREGRVVVEGPAAEIVDSYMDAVRSHESGPRRVRTAGPGLVLGPPSETPVKWESASPASTRPEDGDSFDDSDRRHASEMESGIEAESGHIQRPLLEALPRPAELYSGDPAGASGEETGVEKDSSEGTIPGAESVNVEDNAAPEMPFGGSGVTHSKPSLQGASTGVEDPAVVRGTGEVATARDESPDEATSKDESDDAGTPRPTLEPPAEGLASTFLPSTNVQVERAFAGDAQSADPGVSGSWAGGDVGDAQSAPYRRTDGTRGETEGLERQAAETSQGVSERWDGAPRQLLGTPSGFVAEGSSCSYRATTRDAALRRQMIAVASMADPVEYARLSEEVEAFMEYHGDLPLVTGSGEVKILDVLILGADGVPREQFVTGDTMTVAVMAKAIAPVEDPIFGVAIHRNDEVYVYGPNTSFDRCLKGTYHGLYTFFIHYPSLPLLAGTYLLSVAVFDKHHLKPYVWHNRLYSILIKSDREDHGLVVIPHEWGVVTLASGGRENLGESEPPNPAEKKE